MQTQRRMAGSIGWTAPSALRTMVRAGNEASQVHTAGERCIAARPLIRITSRAPESLGRSLGNSANDVGRTRREDIDEPTDDAPPPQHARPGRSSRSRPRRRRAAPDVLLRPDRLPLRPRRQPPDVPPRRPHPAGRSVPRHPGLPRPEHHRRRPPPRRALRPRRGPDARRGRARAQDDGRDRRRVRGRLPRRRGAAQPPARPRLPAGDRAHPGDARAGRASSSTPGHAYVSDERQRLLRRRVVRRLRARCSGNTLDALRAGHRGDVEPDKRDPADFALWKAAGEGRHAEVADARAGARASRLAPRVLGDGA